MKTVVTLYKEVGETPLACVERFRAAHPEYADVPLTYAGRLDPAAEGVLLVLAGDECKKKKDYLKFSKTYEARIVLGIETDTHDLLGVPVFRTAPVDEGRVMEELQKLEGVHEFSYPAYSSKTVNGIPLWQYAREGRMNEIEVPTREMEVLSVHGVTYKVRSVGDVAADARELIACVEGDFRQDELTAAWKKLEERYEDEEVLEVDVRFEVGSGTYIRTLAHELGARLGSGGALSYLKRTQVGEYTLDDAKE